MIKLFASFIILGTVTLIFYQPIFVLHSRVNFLKNMIIMLNQIKRELQTNLWSVSDMLNNIHDIDCDCINAFINHVKFKIEQNGAAEFSMCWNESAKQSLKYLSAEEKMTILQLGEILGRYSLDEQVTALEKAIHIFEISYESASETYRTNSKYSLCIGVSVGAIVTILLL